jgi:hypothetical protein
MAHDERAITEKRTAALRKRGNILFTLCYLPLHKD